MGLFNTRKNNNGKYAIFFLLGFAVLHIILSVVQFMNERLLMITVLSLLQMVFGIIITMELYTLGFGVVCAFDLIQIGLSVYSYITYRDDKYFMIIGFAAASIVINMLLCAYMSHTLDEYDQIKMRYDQIRNRNYVLSEENKAINESLKRTSLIAKHTRELEESKVTSAIEFSKNTGIDTLTTLPNRNKILKQIEKYIDDDLRPDGRNVQFSVIYICIDSFGDISRRLGHRTTDLFLQGIAHRLRELAAAQDMLAHVSPGEFVVLVKRNMVGDELVDYANMFRRKIFESFKCDDAVFVMTTSAGISTYPDDARFSGELLRSAEIAANHSVGSTSVFSEIKTVASNFGLNSAGNTTLFSSLNEEETAKLKSSFNQAMSQNEIFLVYQPQFDSNLKLLGFEAFLRWKSEEFGIINALDFLTMAEKTDNIFKLGTFAVSKALRELSHINETYPELKMTLNLSSSELKTGRISGLIADLITRYKLNPANIIIDIPEESLTTYFETVKNTLDSLSALGVTLSLDNFGRGYSSLNNIPLLPISIIKLDNNFTRNIAGDDSVKILSSLLEQLLHEIDISISATGIGSDEQFSQLKSLGLDTYQGSYLCSPIVEAEVDAFIVTKLHRDSSQENTQEDPQC